MLKTKLDPRTAPRGGTEHDFAVPRENWETACFDNASYFAVIEMRRDRHRTEFLILPWAIRYASERDDACLYAVAETGRFALLDRARWPEWEDRWMIAKGHRTPTGRVPSRPPGPQKPHLGTITDWERQASPQGLGYAVSGRLGDRRVVTTSILARHGAEVETLNWRYSLGEEKR